jgi:CRISPR-associated protein Csd1
MESLIGHVHDLFKHEDYTNDRDRLSGEFLLGYYCQRQRLLQSRKGAAENEQHDSHEQHNEEDNDDDTSK